MERIELAGVWYRYPGSRAWSLAGVSLAFRRGELVVLLGPNGSGKTTLMKVSALLYRPQRGSVLVDGRDYWSLGEAERTAARRRVTYVHERPVLLSGTVMENVAYGLLLRGLSRREAEERAASALRALGAEGLAGVRASELSAGQAQLVSLARAIALGPDFLFLDEPFSHLDREKRGLLARLARSLADGGACVVVSLHEEGLAERLGPDRVVEVSGGRVAAE